MNRQDIELWLKKYKISGYKIHPNLVVDVHGDVNLFNKGLKLYLLNLVLCWDNLIVLEIS